MINWCILSKTVRFIPLIEGFIVSAHILINIITLLTLVKATM